MKTSLGYHVLWTWRGEQASRLAWLGTALPLNSALGAHFVVVAMNVFFVAMLSSPLFGLCAALLATKDTQLHGISLFAIGLLGALTGLGVYLISGLLMARVAKGTEVPLGAIRLEDSA